VTDGQFPGNDSEVWFQHASDIWAAFPDLVPGLGVVAGITAEANVDAQVERFTTRAAERLIGRSESELDEIQAWRRAFSRMGLKPTQYRCASEALLRRFKKYGTLPRIHPLIDLCNAVSLAYATPIAVFDLAQVTGHLEVRYADGTEQYLTFVGAIEHPSAAEVIFADAAGEAHARRWTNRQSGRSAVNAATTTALVISEALHPTAAADQHRLLDELFIAISDHWHPVAGPAVLTAARPRFEFDSVDACGRVG
jgi:DNA/RNA-binding domain of Phe-tRNA-synthetase-like protein